MGLDVFLQQGRSFVLAQETLLWRGVVAAADPDLHRRVGTQGAVPLGTLAPARDHLSVAGSYRSANTYAAVWYPR